MIRRLGEKIIALSLFTIYHLPFTLFAAGPGTSTSNFLKIGIGARAVGMGGAFSAISDDVSSVYWNPAGLGQLTRKEASFMHNEWVEGISYDYIGYAHPLKPGDKGVFGGSLYYLTAGSIQGYDSGGGVLQEYTADDTAAVFSYGRKLTGKRFKMPDRGLYAGANLKLINKRLAMKSAFGIAIDAGALYKPGWSLLDGNLQFAGVLQNIGTGLKFDEKNDPFPFNFKIGSAYNRILFDNGFTFALDLNVPSDNDVSLNLGAEYVFWNLISLRCGYKSRADLDKGVRFGAGFEVEDMRVDYAFIPFGVLGNTHRFSIGIKFGYVEKTELLAGEVMRHYRRGEKYFQEGLLLLAYGEFSNVAELNPAHEGAGEYIAKVKKMFSETKTIEERKKRESELAEQFEKAKKFFDGGKMIDAKAAFETVLSLDPENKKAPGYIEKINSALEEARSQMADDLFTQGSAYYDKKMYEEAIKNWEKTLEIIPQHKEAKRYLELARKKSEEDKAKKDEDKKQKELEHYYNKGVSTFKKEQWGQAQAAFQWVLKTEPQYKEAKEYLGKIETELNNLAEKNKIKAQELYTQGLRAYTSKKLKKAIELWEQAVELDPDHTKANTSLKRAKEELKKRK
ncbi:MAG: PorV/PorQ family protein [bacterium]